MRFPNLIVPSRFAAFGVVAGGWRRAASLAECGYGIYLTSERPTPLIESNMRWKRGNRPRLVSENEASPPIRGIFAEIRNALGVPVVPLLYQAYAVFPEFLDLHWRAFRPVVESRQFFVLGARLAAECYTRAHNYFQVGSLGWHELGSDAGAALPLAQVLDYYQYLDPLLLLITAAQMQAFEGPIGQAQAARDGAQHPSFPVAPRLLSDTEATTAVNRIWDERRRVLELAFISDEHRALACWPGFYQEYWLALKELLKSPLYADCQYRIADSALKLARELPGCLETTIPQLLEAGLDDEQVSSLARLNDAFLGALSGLLLDITFARIASEGGTRSVPASPQKEPAAAPNASSSTRAA